MYPVDYLQLTPLRASAILTSSYVAAEVIDVAWKYNQIILYMNFTKSGSTSFEWIVEFSPDNVNWYQEAVETYANGVLTVREVAHQIVSANQANASQMYRFAVPINDRYVRISAKGTGTLTSTALEIKSAVGIN